MSHTAEHALRRQWDSGAGSSAPPEQEGMLNAETVGALNAIEAHLFNDSADADEMPPAYALEWDNVLRRPPPTAISNHDNQPINTPLANSGAALESSSSSQPAGAGQGRAMKHRKRPRPEEEKTLRKQRLEQEQYFAGWDAWAQAGGASGGNRWEAVDRMKAWLDANEPEKVLDLSSLELTSLPESLPASLQRLFVNRNQLTSLQESLPASLKVLNAADNQLTSLPESLPASLEELIVSRNQLTSLPESLPALLEQLYAADNQLTRLPESLPALLQRLAVADNRLTSLPEHILTTLTGNCFVSLDNNPLPDRVRNNLEEATTAAGYNGPTFSFSMAAASETAPARPLEHAVSTWYGEDKETVNATWSALPNEEGAKAFSKFLDRLGGTVNSGNPQFRQSVVAWLSHLADHPQLREDTFQLALGATVSCEDRVSLTFNNMKKARLNADVENGDYNERLPDLISLARGMFRLDKLEKIAREKVKSLRYVDEIEVYLAYQVKLRDTLHLPLDTPDMRFFDVSWVTQADLDKAETEVKASEEKEFISYLSTDWAPWQSVLKRLHAVGHKQAQAKLVDAMGNEFSMRLNARLKEIGLENDADAERIVGAQVKVDIQHEINEQLTRDFLDLQPNLEPEKKFVDLLLSPW